MIIIHLKKSIWRSNWLWVGTFDYKEKPFENFKKLEIIKKEKDIEIAENRFRFRQFRIRNKRRTLRSVK